MFLKLHKCTKVSFITNTCKYIFITSYLHVPLEGVHHDRDDGDDEMSADADGEDADYGDVSDDEPLPMFLLLLRKIMELN